MLLAYFPSLLFRIGWPVVSEGSPSCKDPAAAGLVDPDGGSFSDGKTSMLDQALRRPYSGEPHHHLRLRHDGIHARSSFQAPEVLLTS